MKENKIRYASYGFTWKPYVISWVFCLKIEEEKDIFPTCAALDLNIKWQDTEVNICMLQFLVI